MFILGDLHVGCFQVMWCEVSLVRVMKYCMFGLFEPKKKNPRIRPREKPSAVVICEIVLVVMTFNLQSKQQYQL